mgnify:CR=1 FL=1
MNTEFLHPNSTQTYVKICGLMDEEMVDVTVAAGAHAVGFVLVEHSPRYIERHIADQLMLQLPNDVVGIAVVQDLPSLDSFASWNGWIQLCGEENEQTVKEAPCPVIKADRKSTRLNSSHVVISYAVFCLKKKNTKIFFIL